MPNFYAEITMTIDKLPRPIKVAVPGTLTPDQRDAYVQGVETALKTIERTNIIQSEKVLSQIYGRDLLAGETEEPA